MAGARGSWGIVLGLLLAGEAVAEPGPEQSGPVKSDQPAKVQTYPIVDRPQVALVVHYGSKMGEERGAATTELVNAFETALMRVTGLRLQRPEIPSEGCAGKLDQIDVCLYERVFKDDPRRSNGFAIPPDDAVARLTKQDNYPRVIVFLAASDVKTLKLDIRAFSTERATRKMAEVLMGAGSGPVRPLDLQLPMYGGVTSNTSTSGVSNLADPALHRWLIEHVPEPFADYPPLAEVHVTQIPGGAQLEWDGKALGPSGFERTEIVRVPQGDHTLDIKADWRLAYTTKISARPGETLTLSPELVSSPGFYGRRITLGLGAAAVAGGVALLAVGLAKTSADVRFADPTQFPDEQFWETRNGVALVPAGYSLASLGLAWSLGALFWGEDDEIPIWAIAIGVVAGGSAYAISHLAGAK